VYTPFTHIIAKNKEISSDICHLNVKFHWLPTQADALLHICFQTGIYPTSLTTPVPLAAFTSIAGDPFGQRIARKH
jgi:hypothetical protein